MSFCLLIYCPKYEFTGQVKNKTKYICQSKQMFAGFFFPSLSFFLVLLYIVNVVFCWIRGALTFSVQYVCFLCVHPFQMKQINNLQYVAKVVIPLSPSADFVTLQPEASMYFNTIRTTSIWTELCEILGAETLELKFSEAFTEQLYYTGFIYYTEHFLYFYFFKIVHPFHSYVLLRVALSHEIQLKYIKVCGCLTECKRFWANRQSTFCCTEMF